MNQSILIVEDDAEIHQLLEVFLQIKDYQVTVADNGQKALQAIKNQQFELVILDIMLPEIHGMEILKELRLTPGYEKTPVIIFSNIGLEGIKEESEKYGNVEYIIKAEMEMDALASHVEKILSQANQKDQENVANQKIDQELQKMGLLNKNTD